MGKINRKALVLMLAAIGIAAPAIASADAPSRFDDTSIKVSYADLDINSKAGAQTLYSRLKRASEKVCGIRPLVITGSLAATLDARACYREALDASVAKIDSDTLNELHLG